MSANFEGQCGTIRVADVDPLAIVDVDNWDAAIVDVHPVEAAVVDRDPSALVKSQQQVRSGDQRLRDADVRP